LLFGSLELLRLIQFDALESQIAVRSANAGDPKVGLGFDVVQIKMKARTPSAVREPPPGSR
jgi:hypothetical protein